MIKEQCFGFLATPALWTGMEFGIEQFVFPEIDLHGFTPQPISKKIRLGHQMEEVFSRLLTHDTTYELLLHNLLVKDQNRTIGEIDFILRHRETKKLIHVELTYKFYIVDPSLSEPIHCLVGPNRRDLFFNKMEKIRDKQFGLLHTESGIKALSERGIDHEAIVHQACFKAQLFMPFQKPQLHIEPLNTACVHGYWLRVEDFYSTDFQGYRYYIPIKSEWVIAPHNNVDWSSHSEILEEVRLRIENTSAPMVWLKKSDRQFEKLFVVWW
ncbi:hypothetical protein SAMN05421766_103789 [Zobellia uliginosa]|uniref:DUF1853 domain-containing protein n=1 Tax=Zobellia uliginosa TaxID=143224 RepID=A0ABY1KTB3_9FLAO|nr:DUF1853 family protein [Zobellia uliginosa]SIS74734.1 hypothetical protein SAMN05421766_103789 [Zobellia uliginosa]